MSHQTRVRILLFLGSTIAAISLHLCNEAVLAQSTNPTFPAALFPCLPALKQYPDHYILAQVKQPATSYYYIAVNQYRPELYIEGSPAVPEAQQYWEAMIASTRNGQCQVLLGRNQYYQTLLAFLPQPIAQQFALVRLQREIQATGGVARVQAALNQEVSNDLAFRGRRGNQVTYPIAPEKAWAYQQLGITLPPGAVVMPEPKQVGGQNP
ncbi:hypothetical protein BST81_16835 [Leptolyngbya sp. 'hensonii']|nr:hypothetical protein BST81_16835 [Leptolyngbya sp. 'hensonii']